MGQLDIILYGAEEWYPASKNHRDDCHCDLVNQTRGKKPLDSHSAINVHMFRPFIREPFEKIARWFR